MGTNQKQEFVYMIWPTSLLKSWKEKKSNFDKEYILKTFAGLYVNVETR